MSQRSQGNFYGLPGPLGLSTVGITSTSKVPPNGTALGVGNAHENPFNCPTAQSPIKNYPQILTGPGNKPSASMTSGREAVPALQASQGQSGVPTA